MKANDRVPSRDATVLVVDDNVINLSTLFDFLHGEGFGVLVAQSGVNALEILKERTPDIILLDVIMPGMDGFEVCRRLKANEQTHGIPVIFITALSDVEQKIKGFQAGAVDFITKPFHQKEVVARVETHLQLRFLQRKLQEHVCFLEEEVQKSQRLEAALREREQQFQDIAENVREVFFVVSADFTRFLYVNPIYEVIWGQRRQKLYQNSRAWLRQIHTDERQRVLTAIKKLLLEFEEFNEEFRVLRYGATRWVWARAFPIVDDDGELSRFVGVAEDITNRKRMEDDLRQSEAKMRSILNNTLQAFILIDLQGRLVTWNPPANKLSRQFWGEDLREGASWLEYLHEVRRDQFQGMMRIALQGNIAIFESSFEDTTGQKIALEFNLMPVSTETDEVIGVCWSASDISERKRNADILRQAKEDAESANRAKSSFLANMSHELRTPLNGILGYAQILSLDQSLTASQHNAVRVIHQSGRHLLTMINDVLDLSKIEAQKMELEFTTFHLPNLLSELMDMIAVKAQQKGLFYKYEPASDLPPYVVGDEKRLRQVLLNLLSNAVKFTNAGRSFGLRVIRMEHTPPPIPSHAVMIRFEVEDQGIGIPEEQRDKIFQPFQQLGQADLRAEGTGLGLSISQTFVRLMGGELVVESDLDKGSCFRFDLELEIPEGVSAKTSSQPSALINARYSGPAGSVLVADDDVHNRSVLSLFLQSLGFQVIEAKNGVEALQIAKEFEPDLCVLDLVMPKMDGFETTRKIRQIPLLQNTPIIAVSASVLEHTRERSLEAGCDEYLPKPISFEALMKILQKIMKGDWVLNETRSTQSEEELGLTSPIVPPTPEVLQELHAYALKGDVLELQARAEELKEHDTQLQSFSEKLEQLAQNFAIDELQSFLKQFLE